MHDVPRRCASASATRLRTSFAIECRDLPPIAIPRGYRRKHAEHRNWVLGGLIEEQAQAFDFGREYRLELFTRQIRDQLVGENTRRMDQPMNRSPLTTSFAQRQAYRVRNPRHRRRSNAPRLRLARRASMVSREFRGRPESPAARAFRATGRRSGLPSDREAAISALQRDALSRQAGVEGVSSASGVRPNRTNRGRSCLASSIRQAAVTPRAPPVTTKTGVHGEPGGFDLGPSRSPTSPEPESANQLGGKLDLRLENLPRGFLPAAPGRSPPKCGLCHQFGLLLREHPAIRARPSSAARSGRVLRPKVH